MPHLRPRGHISHSESSLPKYLLIRLHLRYSRRVSLITFISQYGFGLVGFHIWLVVRTSRPNGPTTSRGFCPTLLVAGFRSSQSFLDLFQSVQSLRLCPSAPLSRVFPRSLRITAAAIVAGGNDIEMHDVLTEDNKKLQPTINKAVHHCTSQAPSHTRKEEAWPHLR